MDWLFAHFKFVVIAVIIVVTLLRHLAESKNKGQKARQSRRQIDGDEDVFGPEEVWKMLQKQLPAQTPPPLKRQADPPPLRVEASETDMVLKRQQDMQARLQQIKENKSNTGAPSSRDSAAAAKGHSKTMPANKAGLRASLRDRRQARRAMVMREILGPPLGLR